MQAPDLGKTKLCKTVLEGAACNNPGCRYAHSAEELRKIRGPLSFHSADGPGQLASDESASFQVRHPLLPGLQVPHAYPERVCTTTLEAVSTPASEAIPQVPVYSQLQQPRGAGIINQNAVQLGSLIRAVPVKGTVSEALASLQQIVQMVSDFPSSVTHKEKECVQAELTHVISMLHCNQQLDGNSVRSGSTQSALSTSDGDCTLDLDIETCGQSSYSRQTTPDEFESVPAWSRQVSAWGYNPTHRTETLDSGITETDRLSAIRKHNDLHEELSSESSDDGLEAHDSFHVPCDNHDAPGKGIHDTAGMSLSLDSLPDLPWARQESSKSTISTGSAMFEEMSSAYGLHWQVKNTFLDVDPVAQLVKPARKTRSVTPPPRHDMYDLAEDQFDLGCFTRQFTK